MRAVAVFPFGKGAEKLQNSPREQQHQRENRTQLDHHRVHLPIGAGQVDVKHRLHQPQVRRGADGEKFGQSFDDP